MKDVVVDETLVSACGLYCGACRSYLKGSCPGCQENGKATWCRVRTCCHEKSLTSCASCKEHEDVRACRKFNNRISKIIGFVLRSDRYAGIMRIKSVGRRGFAGEMAECKRHAVRRGKYK